MATFVVTGSSAVVPPNRCRFSVTVASTAARSTTAPSTSGTMETLLPSILSSALRGDTPSSRSI